ncbi:MAG TPA: hypothetical protein VI854_03105 [Acidimicrobiia bacterium]|nr:hypothetical protein [Acidimicrobiia bacterium]
MSPVQLEFTAAELLTDDPVVEPLVAGGLWCHGGFDDDGAYRSPRTRFRRPAIAAWQARHRREFGTQLLDVPLETWPPNYPNVAQAKFLLRHGVRQPVISTLTRIGTVEGFGALIRHSAVPDIQRFFDEDLRGTATAHLDGGLLEAHARDEAGFEGVAGHQEMWFAARDAAFEHPVTEDQTAAMLARMGFSSGVGTPDPGLVRRQMEAARRFPDVDLSLEMLVSRMIRILLIEISAFHVFAWADEVLSDTDLVAGDGEAVRLVTYIRQDETPHVDYLRTSLTEMRDRTFIGGSGRRHAGAEVIGRLWQQGLADSLGVRREETARLSLREVHDALDGRADAADLLAEFHGLGDERPSLDGDATASLY